MGLLQQAIKTYDAMEKKLVNTIQLKVNRLPPLDTL